MALLSPRDRAVLGVGLVLATLYFIFYPELKSVLGEVALVLAIAWLAPMGWALGPWRGTALGLATAIPLYLEGRSLTDIATLTLAAALVSGTSGWIQRRTKLYSFRERALRFLGRTGQVATEASHPAELLEEAVKEAVKSGGYSLAMVWEKVPGGFMPRAWHLANPQYRIIRDGRILTLEKRGRPVLTLDLGELDWGETAAGEALAKGEVVAIGNVLARRDYALARAARALGYRSAMAVPIASGSRVRGILAVTSNEVSPFAREEAALLSEVGALLGSALERLELRERLRLQAITDSLTGLLNRRGFLDWGKRVLENARRDGRPMALLYLDLDRFKLVNDTMGHSVGDKLLEETAERLRFAVRRQDLLARLGGDEFAALIEGDSEAALKVASRIRQVVGEPLNLDGKTFRVEASVGIALFPDDGDDLEELMRKGDLAMYEAKRSRKGIVFADSASDHAVRGRVALEVALRRALSEGRLLPHYQPIVDWRERRVELVEALARWEVPPSSFVPLAEEAGFVHELDLLIMERALADLTRWRREGLDLGVAVNISPLSLARDDFPAAVRDLLLASDLPPSRVVIEVTEAALMRPKAELALERLRELGIEIAVDDFGTGYSSIARVKTLPLSFLKIPREFIANVTTSSTDRAIVTGIRVLAQELGFEVVAEGVDTGEQAQVLGDMGYRLMQGFFFSPAMPPEQVPGWVRDFEAARTA